MFWQTSISTDGKKTHSLFMITTGPLHFQGRVLWKKRRRQAENAEFSSNFTHIWRIGNLWLKSITSHFCCFILMLWKTRLLSELHSSTRKESKFIQRTFRVTHAQIYRQMMMAGWKILTYRQILQFKYVQAQIPCSVLCNVTYVNSLFASWPYDGG